MKMKMKTDEIVKKLQEHAIKCAEIDSLIEGIIGYEPDGHDSHRPPEDNLFGQAALAILQLESGARWDSEHILELKQIRLESALDVLYHQQKSERLLEENTKLLKSKKFLEDELNQLAAFNPDWDMLQASQESLRTHMLALRKVWVMADTMQWEADDLMVKKQYDGAAHLDHWAGQIKDLLDDVYV